MNDISGTTKRSKKNSIPSEAIEIWHKSEDSTLRRYVIKTITDQRFSDLSDICLGYVLYFGTKGGRTMDSTLRYYEAHFRCFLEYALNNAISIINPNPNLKIMYNNYLRSLTYTIRSGRRKGQQSSYSRQAINSRMTAARTLYTALREAGATTQQPFGSYRKTKDSTDPAEKRESYTPEEIEILLSNATPVEKALILLGAHGGLRVQEVVDLNWSDINLDLSELTVLAGKGDKQRRVTMSSSLIRSIQTMPRTRFNHNGLFRWRNDVSIRAKIKEVCDRSGVKYKGYHSLRHYCGTRLMEECNDLEQVARHLGHSSIETAKIYVKLNSNHIKNAVKNW